MLRQGFYHSAPNSLKITQKREKWERKGVKEIKKKTSNTRLFHIEDF